MKNAPTLATETKIAIEFKAGRRCQRYWLRRVDKDVLASLSADALTMPQDKFRAHLISKHMCDLVGQPVPAATIAKWPKDLIEHLYGRIAPILNQG